MTLRGKNLKNIDLIMNLHLKKVHKKKVKDENIRRYENDDVFISSYGKDYDNKNREKKLKMMREETIKQSIENIKLNLCCKPEQKIENA